MNTPTYTAQQLAEQFGLQVHGDGITAIDFGFVAGKWADPVWMFWDLAMLWLAMLHGTNGVRTIINDYADLWLDPPAGAPNSHRSLRPGS